SSAAPPRGTEPCHLTLSAPAAKARSPARTANNAAAPERPVTFKEAPTSTSAAVAAENPIRSANVAFSEFTWLEGSLGSCPASSIQISTGSPGSPRLASDLAGNMPFYTSQRAPDDGFRASPNCRPPRPEGSADGQKVARARRERPHGAAPAVRRGVRQSPPRGRRHP